MATEIVETDIASALDGLTTSTAEKQAGDEEALNAMLAPDAIAASSSSSQRIKLSPTHFFVDLARRLLESQFLKRIHGFLAFDPPVS